MEVESGEGAASVGVWGARRAWPSGYWGELRVCGGLWARFKNLLACCFWLR